MGDLDSLHSSDSCKHALALFEIERRWCAGDIPRGDECVAALDDHREELEQLWVTAEIWHSSRRKKPRHLDVLLDTGASDSFMSLAMWNSLKPLIKRRLDRWGVGALHAANPVGSNTPPMQILGQVAVPLLFENDSKCREVSFRVVDGLPYAAVLGKRYLKRNKSALDFRPFKGFQPEPGAPFVPFSKELNQEPYGPRLTATEPVWDTYQTLNAMHTRPPDVSAEPPSVPTHDQICWEDESSLEWKVRQVEAVTSIQGFTNVALEAAAVGVQPQDRQLVMVLPTEKYDVVDKGAEIVVAKSVMWWVPGSPVYVKVVNRTNKQFDLVGAAPIARMIALNVRDKARFQSLFDDTPSSVDPPLPEPPLAKEHNASSRVSDDYERTVRAGDANMGTLGALQKQQMIDVLTVFIEEGLFPIDPKRVPACIDGELELPLINEHCTPFASKQRRFSEAERKMIRAEIQKLLDRGIIMRFMSPWAAQCLCVKKKDGTVRLCIDWRELNKRLVKDSGGLGNMQDVFDGLKGKKYYTQLDLASGFHQLPISPKDREKTAFRDCDGNLFMFLRAGFGLTVLPAAFSRRVKSALGNLEGVFSWLDDILIASSTWEEHLATLTLVLTRLRAAGLSVNFAKCIFGAASQEFLGMIIDSTGLHPAPSKLEAIAKMPRPSNVETLRSFLGLTSYLRQFVKDYSIIAAPLTNILRNKEFASKRARKTTIPWGAEEEAAFQGLRSALSSPTVLAFPDPNKPFELHTDASETGAGATLVQDVGGTPRVIAFASHRFSRTDSRRGPTERECMGILWGVDHFKQYLSGREFKLVTDCSALTWLFRSRELCPKLHRWALRLMEYDLVLAWRPGAQHVLPEALSRLPHAPQPQPDIDDSFPDDVSVRSAAAAALRDPSGPTLDGIRLADLEALVPDSPPAVPTISTGVQAPSLSHDVLSALHAFEELPSSDACDVNPRPLRRSSRTPKANVRLKPLGDLQLPSELPLEVLQRPPCPLSVIDPQEPTSVPAAPDLPPLDVASIDNVVELLNAGGEVPSSRAADLEVEGSASSTVEHAIHVLTRPESFVQRQREDALLGQVWRSLSGTEEQSAGQVDVEGYHVGTDGILRFQKELGKKLLAVPQSMVPEILALVHTLHGHVGVGATIAITRKHFFWHTLAKDARLYVLSCGCNRRKRPNSRRVAMTLGRPLEPWAELQMDILRIDTASKSGNNYVLLVVDRATKFPFAFPLPSKQAEGVARVMTELCLMFGVPDVVSCDGGGEFGALVVKHLCRWLKAKIRYGPAEHPRSQGAAERLGGWLQELLAELCKSWPERWDEYVSPSIWIKRTLPDTTLPSKLTPFEMLFGRPPRTSLDSLVPLESESEATGGLDNFVERRKQNMREVRVALEQRHSAQTAARQKANQSISRPSPGVSVETGDLVLVRESDSSRHRDGRGKKLQHEVYTGPWEVSEVLQRGLSVKVLMNGRKKRERNVSLADVKLFHTRPPSLRHSLADEFAQFAWTADFKLSPDEEQSPVLDSIADCRRVIKPSGTRVWEYKGRTSDGRVSDWLPENKILEIFTPLQLDVFIALWHLYNPNSSKDPTPLPRKPGAPLSREEALRLFPIGHTFWKSFGGGIRLQGQVYGYRNRYWRVRYSDQDWEELTRHELQRLSR